MPKISSILILLLCITPHLCQKNHVVEVISRLNNLFGFDNNIFFLDSHIDHDLYIPLNDNTGSTYSTQVVYSYVEGSKFVGFLSIKRKNKLLIVAAESSKFQNSSLLLEFVKEVQLRDNLVKVAVFITSNVTSMDIVEQLFRWSWSNGIVNIFCAFYYNDNYDSPLSVFRYEPFGQFDVINVTGSESLRNYFPDRLPDFRRSSIAICATDIPDYMHPGNLEWQFWNTAFSYLNATKTIIKSCRKGHSKEPSNNVYLFEYPSGGSPTYPHRTTSYMLLVPHARPYSDFVTYLQNGTWTVLLVYSFIVIATATLVLTFVGYLQTRKILLFQCVTDVINLLLNDNGAINYSQLHMASVCVMIPMTFVGLIVMNGILSVFQSYLTFPIYERQISTIDDLHQVQIEILEDENNAQTTIKRLEYMSQQGNWKNKVQAVDFSLIAQQIAIFNNSAVYIVEYDYARILLETQKRLNLKAYHLITQKPLYRAHVGFYTYPNFAFAEVISRISQQCQDAGLLYKWLQDGYQTRMENVLKVHPNFRSKFNLNSSEFAVPTIVWYGWIISVVVLICEIIWNKVELKVVKLKIRFKGLDLKKFKQRKQCRTGYTIRPNACKTKSMALINRDTKNEKVTDLRKVRPGLRVSAQNNAG